MHAFSFGATSRLRSHCFMSSLCAGMRQDPAVAYRTASAIAPGAAVEASKISASVAMQFLVLADKLQDMHEKQRVPDDEHQRWLRCAFQHVDELLTPQYHFSLESSIQPNPRTAFNTSNDTETAPA